jgi:hypothetical protein
VYAFRLVREREGRVAANKTDEELQFNLQLLSEVLSVRNSQLYRYEYQPAASLRGPLCQKLTALQVRVSTCSSSPRFSLSETHSSTGTSTVSKYRHLPVCRGYEYLPVCRVSRVQINISLLQISMKMWNNFVFSDNFA